MTNAGTGTWRGAIDLDELWEGDMAGVEVAGVDVLLVNLDGRIRAYENRCPHQGGALDEGDFDGSTIVCGRHLWEFDADSGAGINPAGEQLTTYPCRVTDDTVEVNLPS
jgi:toluene monooxygenase system ferredoxin subunit